jgi:hypothetical protein
MLKEPHFTLRWGPHKANLFPGNTPFTAYFTPETPAEFTGVIAHTGRDKWEITSPPRLYIWVPNQDPRGMGFIPGGVFMVFIYHKGKMA